MGWWRRLVGAESGSIAVMGALSLVSMLGMSSLAVEVGSGYAAKIRNQRVADMAALGAAAAYTAAGTCVGDAGTCPAAVATATDLFTANGLSTANASIAVSGTSASGITVAVTTHVPVRIGQILGADATYDVTNVAVASTGSAGTNGCVTILGSVGNDVTVTGGTGLTASGCAINANGVISSNNPSAKVTARQITAAGISDAAAAYGQNAITATQGIAIRAGAATDNLKAKAAIQGALCSVNRLTGGSDGDYADGNTNCASPLVTAPAPLPSGSATDVTFTSGTPVAAYAAYYSGGTYTLPPGNYTFRNVTVNGGVTVIVGDGDFRADSLNMGGNGMTFGNGSVVISGTFGFNNGSRITIGNGPHDFGALNVTGGRQLVIGSGNLTVRGSITESGGSSIKVAIAAGNAVTINGDGATTPTAINIGGGSYVCFTSDCSAPTVTAGTFSAGGQIVTAGGSTLVLPIAATHVINGDLNLNGNSIFGGGLYVVKGNFTNNTGGTMTGSNVSFALGGTFTLTGGTSLDLAAPTGASGLGVTDVLVMTKSSGATTIGGGSQDKYSGMFYAPNSAMSMSGGSAISSNGSACLMVLLKSLTLSGSGALTTSSCASQSQAAFTAPVLIR